jgi:hypothetical protein
MPAPFARLISNRPIQYASQGLGTRVRQQLLRQKFLNQTQAALGANLTQAGRNVVEYGSPRLSASIIKRGGRI